MLFKYHTVLLFRHYGDGAAVHPAAVHDDLRVAVPHAHAHGRRPREGEEDQGEPQDGRPQGLRLLVSMWTQILVRIRIRGSIPLALTKGSVDPDPAIFVSDLQDINKKFFCLLLFEGVHLYHFSKIHTLTNGSGSGRPKNIWTLRIRIRNKGLEIKKLTQKFQKCTKLS